MQAVLVSPHFLFRVELDRAAERSQGHPHPISEYELASRLSYFLWSSMPDDELFEPGPQETLHEPEMLEKQVRRMLKDPQVARPRRELRRPVAAICAT